MKKLHRVITEFLSRIVRRFYGRRGEAGIARSAANRKIPAHENLPDHACHEKRYVILTTPARFTVFENRSRMTVGAGRNGFPWMGFMASSPDGAVPSGTSPTKWGRSLKPGETSSTIKGNRALFVSAPCEVSFRREVKNGVRRIIIEDAVIDLRLQGALFSNAKTADLARAAA